MYWLHHILREVAVNTAMAVPAIQLIRAWRGRTASRDIKTQARQMRDQFEFFLGTLGSVEGKSVVEVGPGDTIALGALFLKSGARQYIAFDRFPGDVFGPYASALYAELGCGHVDRQRMSLRSLSIEDVRTESQELVDVIVSFDVIEHLRDPHKALRNMAKMLNPKGIMVHRVDYSPHDFWRNYPNGLQFLTIPDWVWTLMGSNRGYPNRTRHADLVRTLNALGFHLSQRITRKFTLAELDEVRSRLLPRYRTTPDHELLVSLAEFACSRSEAPVLGPAFPY